jgi:hypothetical protein
MSEISRQFPIVTHLKKFNSMLLHFAAALTAAPQPSATAAPSPQGTSSVAGSAGETLTLTEPTVTLYIFVSDTHPPPLSTANSR